MNNKSCAESEQSHYLPFPAFPKTGSEVFRSLKKAMDRIECPPGIHLTQKQFGQLTGIPRSTVNDWYHGNLAFQIRYFLSALERLPDAARIGLLHEICRECPRLDHPALSHNPKGINSLKALVARPTGLSMLRGDSKNTRDFVLAAIGHSAGRLRPGSPVAGLDAAPPGPYVPVSGVRTMLQPPNWSKASLLLRSLEKEKIYPRGQLLLFSGLWSGAPETRPIMLRLAKHHNVIMADQFPRSLLLPHKTQVANLITAEANKRGRIFIQIDPESPRP